MPLILILLLIFPLHCALAASAPAFGPSTSVTNIAAVGKSTKRANLIDQTIAQAHAKSAGCIECHKGVKELHDSPSVVLGCTDCHGGNPTPGLLNTRKAHVQPRNLEFWRSSANPVDSSVLLNHESDEFIQFVNPGDLRVAANTCGQCHEESFRHVLHSMMNHGAMLWGAALYNNGSVPFKDHRYGQAYGPGGVALELHSPTDVTPEQTRTNGLLSYILPLQRFALSQPGNILRIFEKGGEKPLQLGLPTVGEPPGRPLRRLSERGLGTLNRTDPVFLNLQKTRLHDPLLGFMGSSDHPGDYRSSGCTACHVVYANDRSPINSGGWHEFGHQGLAARSNPDPQIPKNERGHPITHRLTRSIPSSQCMVCHMHQGNLFVNPYLGYTWWDQESDGEVMYPKKQTNPTEAELAASLRKNPEAAAVRGLWGDSEFLEGIAQTNSTLKHNQFADYHGHGWIFRAVFKKDRKGNLLDSTNGIISPNDAEKWSKVVHLKDAHLDRGMHCVDCHFLTDVHGNGNLYGEPRAATTIECVDCHGTINRRPTLITSGNGGQIDLGQTSTPWGPRFQREGTRLFQSSMLQPERRWEIPQTVDTIDPKSRHYNAKSRYAKTLRRDGRTWGDVPESADCPKLLAHENSAISCQICHSSWATSCFGCHLPMRANQRVPLNKFEGMTTRNYTPYNPQVLRDDVFMLGWDSTVKSNLLGRNRMAVLRSSSAVLVGSQNANREWVYSQQQTISAEGYSGQAFNPHFPHTTSGRGTTKNCTDCHLSQANDNNAIMTQLLGFGTGTVNFFGRYVYVGAGKDGFYAVIWTEQDEPQAAIGSYLHKVAYPENHDEHVDANRILKKAYHHHGHEILDLTLRGEYLYTANGEGGFEVFDVANVDQKGFSERMVTAPVSPLGQRTYVRTKYATSVALPSTLALDPARTRYIENEEQPIHPLYAYVYVTDREEGLIIVNVATLVDGNPENNFLKKDMVFNPDGKLTGATHCFVAGQRLYITCSRGLVVVDLDPDPNLNLTPRIVGEYSGPFLRNPRAVAVQFRYCFVTDAEGFKIFDITNPDAPAPIETGRVDLKNAGGFYLARTYAYVANGAQGLAIINIENPERPTNQMFNADGALNDTRAVQIGSVNASMFALVADGKNGLRVLQMISPENVPEFGGFSPMPQPKLIATYPTHGPALAMSRGLDRDRIVDETGNQTVVFGRRGSRPFHVDEMEAFYRQYVNIYPTNQTQRRTGEPYKVEDLNPHTSELSTRSGSPLERPREFKPIDPPPQPSPPPVRDRLTRRGK